MKQMILSRIGFESLRVAFPAACGAKRSRQRARRPAHRCTRTAHPLFSEDPTPWGGGSFIARPLRIFVLRTGNLSLTAGSSDRTAVRPARSRQELWTRSCEPYCAYPSETVPASECRKGGGHELWPRSGRRPASRAGPAPDHDLHPAVLLAASRGRVARHRHGLAHANGGHARGIDPGADQGGAHRIGPLLRQALVGGRGAAIVGVA